MLFDRSFLLFVRTTQLIVTTSPESLRKSGLYRINLRKRSRITNLTSGPNKFMLVDVNCLINLDV